MSVSDLADGHNWGNLARYIAGAAPGAAPPLRLLVLRHTLGSLTDQRVINSDVAQVEQL